METNKPAYEKRLSHIRLAIWENPADGKSQDAEGNARAPGKVFHNVTISRVYRIGEVWHEAPTFNGLADLALVAECITLAKAWIAGRER